MICINVYQNTMYFMNIHINFDLICIFLQRMNEHFLILQWFPTRSVSLCPYCLAKWFFQYSAKCYIIAVIHLRRRSRKKRADYTTSGFFSFCMNEGINGYVFIRMWLSSFRVSSYYLRAFLFAWTRLKAIYALMLRLLLLLNIRNIYYNSDAIIFYIMIILWWYFV